MKKNEIRCEAFFLDDLKLKVAKVCRWRRNVGRRGFGIENHVHYRIPCRQRFKIFLC